jgi:hypothetical protein
MKTSRIIIILFLLVSYLGCGFDPLSKNYPISDSGTDNTVKGKIPQCSISKEVAILIAKGHVTYNMDLPEYNAVAKDEGDKWFIQFKPKEGIYGGWVEVDKSSGEVLDFYVSK